MNSSQKNLHSINYHYFCYDNGIKLTDKKDIANKFNTYFTNIGHSIAEDIKYAGNKTYSSFLNKQINSTFTFEKVGEDTVKKVIQSLPTKNSYGFDGISSKLLKIIEPVIIKSLAILINQVLHTGMFPDKLKIAKVIPIFKKGDLSLFENYRPISLLPSISKVLEKIIFTQLSSYFNDLKLLFDNQYGFRPKHSTEYAALELIDRIVTQMDTNDIPISIFLDLSKAFDTIDHNILLNKLKYYGLRGSTLQLLKSYLQNRKQYIEIEDIKSDILSVTIGVPQGSILGPLLFVIYINDFSQASHKFDFIMYADDTTLFSTVNSFSDNPENKNIQSSINEELSKVIEWLKINKLSLNKNKSKYMIFHMPNKRTTTFTPKIDDVNIEKVDEFIFLGLTLDSNLNWKKHTEKVSNKCSKIIGILNRLKYVLPVQIKVLLYNSLLLSHINYCIMAWGYQGNRVMKIQKKAMRIITLNKYNSHTEPLFKKLNLLKVEDILKLQELKFYFRYIHKNLPDYLLKWQIVPKDNIHNYDTRNTQNIYTFRTKHDFAMKCLKYNLPHAINNTPDLIKDKIYTHSMRGFSIYVKNYFLQKYDYRCTLSNCYTCHQNI